jgi:hypothetical protein
MRPPPAATVDADVHRAFSRERHRRHRFRRFRPLRNVFLSIHVRYRMPPFAGVANALAPLFAFVLVGRAVAKLLQRPSEEHRELVPAWERRTTTAVGVPLVLVGASTMTNGPLAVPYDPLAFTLFGVVSLVYPDFTPSALD